MATSTYLVPNTIGSYWTGPCISVQITLYMDLKTSLRREKESLKNTKARMWSQSLSNKLDTCLMDITKQSGLSGWRPTGIRGSWLPAGFKVRVTEMFVCSVSSWDHTHHTNTFFKIFTGNTCITQSGVQERKIRSMICEMFCDEVEILSRSSLFFWLPAWPLEFIKKHMFSTDCSL